MTKEYLTKNPTWNTSKDKLHQNSEKKRLLRSIGRCIDGWIIFPSDSKLTISFLGIKTIMFQSQIYPIILLIPKVRQQRVISLPTTLSIVDSNQWNKYQSVPTQTKSLGTEREFFGEGTKKCQWPILLMDLSSKDQEHSTWRKNLIKAIKRTEKLWKKIDRISMTKLSEEGHFMAKRELNLLISKRLRMPLSKQKNS